MLLRPQHMQGSQDAGGTGFVGQCLLLEHRRVCGLRTSLAHGALFAGAPGPPGVPIIVRYSSAIAIHWSSGDPGKGPVTRYVIEARPSGTAARLPGCPVERGPRLTLSLRPSPSTRCASVFVP